MSEKRQIEEMALDLYELSGTFDENYIAERLYKIGYRKQSVGEWEYHECVASYDGTISGYCCTCCSAFIHEEVYEDTSFPNKFCPECGARMKGGRGNENML